MPFIESHKLHKFLFTTTSHLPQCSNEEEQKTVITEERKQPEWSFLNSHTMTTFITSLKTFPKIVTAGFLPINLAET